MIIVKMRKVKNEIGNLSVRRTEVLRRAHILVGYRERETMINCE